MAQQWHFGSQPQFGLVGRHEELLALRRHLASALTGSGCTVVLRGEAGVGKTRLLEELAVVARERDALPLRADVVPARAGMAHGLIAGLLLNLIGQSTPTQVAELRDAIRDLAPHLWPVLFPAERPLDIADEDLSRIDGQVGLFPPRLISILLARAQSQPLVLCFEDLHDADNASRHLIAQLASRSNSVPMLIILALRPAAEQGSVRRELQELSSREYVYSMDLAPLSEKSTRALVSSRFDREGFTPDLFETLYRRSRGIPLYLVQYLDSLQHDGAIYREHELWQNRRLREDDMPDSVKEAIRKRIEDLPAEDQELLSYASVQGDTFEGRLLAKLLVEPETALLRKLADLMARTGLVRSDHRGFAFSHPVIAETFYQRLSESKRRHAHNRIGFLVTASQPEAAETLAYHFYRGAAYKRALPHLVKASHRATRVGAWREARIYLTQALEATDHTQDKSARQDVLLTLADVESRLGEPARSLDLCRQALSEGGRDAESSSVARAWKEMGWAHFRRSAMAEAEDCYAGALQRYVELGDKRNCAAVEMRIGHIAFERSELDVATSRYRHAREMATTVKDHALVASVDLSLGVVASVRGDYEEAILNYTAALSDYRKSGDHYGMCQSYHNLGLTHAVLGSLDTALRCYTQAIEVAERLGVADVMANILVSQAAAQVHAGDIEEADVSCRRSSVLMEQLGDRLGAAECLKVDGMICASRDQLERAVQRLSDGGSRFEQLGNSLGKAECEQELAAVRRQQGNDAGAQEHLQRALELYRSVDARKEAEAIVGLLGEASAADVLVRVDS